MKTIQALMQLEKYFYKTLRKKLSEEISNNTNNKIINLNKLVDKYKKIESFEMFQLRDYENRDTKSTSFIEHKGVRLWFDDDNVCAFVFLGDLDPLEFDFKAWLTEVKGIIIDYLKNI